MKNLWHILFIAFLITKFKILKCHQIADLQSEGEIAKGIHTATVPEIEDTSTTTSVGTITPTTNLNFSSTKTPLGSKEESVFNKSIEYLVEEPTLKANSPQVIIKTLNEFPLHLQEYNFTTLSSDNKQSLALSHMDAANPANESVTENLSNQLKDRHSQEVIIKPLKEFSVNLITTLNSEKTQNPVNESKAKELSNQFRNQQKEISEQNQSISKESQKEEVTLPPVYEKKDELIINLLKPSHNEVLKEPYIASNKSDIVQIKQESQIPTAFVKDRVLKESTMTSIKMRINPLNNILHILTKEPAQHSAIPEQELSLKSTTTETQTTESINTQPINEDTIEPVTLRILYKEQNKPTNDHEKVTTPQLQQQESTLKSEDDLTYAGFNEKPTVSLLHTLANPLWPASGEEEVTTLKPLTTLDDYAVKQMNFILDHMLLESQAFVAKVLQATGNTIFQRDHLKRYAETVDHLLNPQQESDYSDDISDPKPLTKQDLYEEVLKKLYFFRSKATKELQKYLPANWVKDYKDTKEELKLWLDKASNDMHHEFNLYLNEEEDHIKYLYFNEAFEDITRATEIHQKLALLADLIKIVKNKKQITFMDLYMQ